MREKDVKYECSSGDGLVYEYCVLLIDNKWSIVKISEFNNEVCSNKVICSVYG